MFNRLIRSTRNLAAQCNNKSTTFRRVALDTASGMFITTYHAITVIGIAALATSALMFYSPALASQLKAQLAGLVRTYSAQPETAGTVAMDMPAATRFKQSITENPEVAYAGQPMAASPHNDAPPKKLASDQRQQQWVTNWISKRYRVAADATDMLVSAAYATSNEIKLDPLLILAVVAIESGFNPFAESAVGAQGLMQVMSKIHHEKFQKLGGIKAALNPVANIKVGSSILKEYVSRGGSVEAGLKMYVGAAAFDNDAGYGSKVLAEYNRLKAVAAGKSVPVITTTAAATSRAPQKALVEVVATPRNAQVLEDKPILPEARSTVAVNEKVAEM